MFNFPLPAHAQFFVMFSPPRAQLRSSKKGSFMKNVKNSSTSDWWHTQARASARRLRKFGNLISGKFNFVVRKVSQYSPHCDGIMFTVIAWISQKIKKKTEIQTTTHHRVVSSYPSRFQSMAVLYRNGRNNRHFPIIFRVTQSGLHSLLVSAIQCVYMSLVALMSDIIFIDFNQRKNSIFFSLRRVRSFSLKTFSDVGRVETLLVEQ